MYMYTHYIHDDILVCSAGSDMRGYKKTADGKTTSYFHTEISEEAKKLIEAQGFGKPQKLEAPGEESDVTLDGWICGFLCFFWI